MTANKHPIIFVEYVAIFLALIFGIRWVANPQGPFEPLIVLCTLILSSIGLWRRNRVDAAIPVSTRSQKLTSLNQKAIASKDAEGRSYPSFADSRAFFSYRFAQAFPGIRKPRWYAGKTAIERLSILLAPPLRSTSLSDIEMTPIWWFRGGNMPIDSFRILNDSTVLLDAKELVVKRIYVFYTENYKRLFVYLEANPSLPTGLYPKNP